MNKKDSQFIKCMRHVLPDTALRMREAGFPQGRTRYLWHKNGQGVWVMYKRNEYDISSFGDKYHYKRWVSAPTINEAQRWAESLREMKKSLENTTEIVDFLKAILGFLEDRENLR